MDKSFCNKCYMLLKKVPCGKVVSYGEIARALNSRAYRAVGNAMKRNHDRKIPCHRVIKSSGEVGGFNRGRKEKVNLLRKEGISVKKGRVDMERFGYKF